MSQAQLIRTTILSVQQNKTIPRLWLEGRYLEKAGFKKGCSIRIGWHENKINIKLDDNGKRIVSARKSMPVIDINNKKILTMFQISEKVQVVVKIGEIVITKTKRELRKLWQLRDRSCGSVFSGGGLLDEAARKAGFKTKWGVEINSKYADIWQENHSGIMHNGDIADIDLNLLEPVELLIGGIPCEPFSLVRRNQNTEMPEEHEDADLSMFFLTIVEKVNPRLIILEEVPQYIKSGIGTATMSALSRMGYNVDYRIVSGKNYGELEIRKRAVIIASMDKIRFPKHFTTNRTMKEILLPVNDSKCEWFDKDTKGWVFEQWKNQKKKGNNFFDRQIITKNTKNVQAITRRYFAQQAGNPIVEHPTKKSTYRWLTITEVKKLTGLANRYYLGDLKNIAGEILGQGVLVNVFRRIIKTAAGDMV